MPVIRWQAGLEVTRRLSVSLDLKLSVTRGAPPGTTQGSQQNARGDLKRAREALTKSDQRIEQLERKLDRSEAISNLESVPYNGVNLPSKHQRPCGARFQEDDFYVASARKEADRLASELGLTTESSVLDVGSGPGRIAIGILDRVGEIREYRGVDVSEPSVHWGQKHIQSRHPSFQFVHLDVENSRYNPDGSRIGNGFMFPFSEAEFDIICLYSVFTHMLTEDVRAYLKEFHRVLKPSGKIFLNAFVEDGVPDVVENPEGYMGREWKGALHCVRYNRDFFRGLLEENGFQLDRFAFDKAEGQQGIYISRSSLA